MKKRPHVERMPSVYVWHKTRISGFDSQSHYLSKLYAYRKSFPPSQSILFWKIFTNTHINLLYSISVIFCISEVTPPRKLYYSENHFFDFPGALIFTQSHLDTFLGKCSSGMGNARAKDHKSVYAYSLCIRSNKIYFIIRSAKRVVTTEAFKRNRNLKRPLKPRFYFVLKVRADFLAGFELGYQFDSSEE